MEKERKFIDGSLLIKEDESKATINTKHFIANNGTEKVIVSSEALHFYDENNKKWRNIDNSLEETEGGYSARFGKYKAKLSDGETTEKVEVIGEKRSFSWEYLGTTRPKEVYAHHDAHRKRAYEAKPEKRVPGKFGGASSKVLYEKSDGNVDLEYIVKGNSIKENIVVREKAEVYKYYYALKADGFNIKLAENSKSIELYAKDNDTVGSVPEFVIPEPYMFDANGVSSNNVFYELEEQQEGLYLFSVEADAAWINAPERVLPVTIDPQILEYEVSNANTIISAISYTTTYYYQSNPYDSCGNTTVARKNSSNGIRVNKNQDSETYCRINVNCAKIPLVNSETVNSAKLILTSSSSSLSNAFRISGAEGRVNGKTYEVNITKHVNSRSNLYFDLIPNYGYNVEFKYSGTDAPYILLEYALNDANNTKKHIIPLIDNVIGEYNLFTDEFVIGFEDISDPVLGIGISHLYKDTDVDYHCGDNFRLNIDETLNKLTNSPTGEMYEYIDPMGMSHKFKERFYYLDNRNDKVYIDDSNDENVLHVDAGGMLWYDISSGTEKVSHKAYRELYTIGGMMASSKIENVKNCEWLEQRSEEQKNLGDQINAYLNTILNYVAVDNTNGEIVDEIRYISDAQEIIENNSWFLTKNEAIEFKQYHIDRYGLKPNTEVYEQSLKIRDYYNDLFEINRTNLKKYYKEYLVTRSKQKALIRQMPVVYLTSDAYAKGFNGYGELVVIYDKNGNYNAIEREEYTSSGKSRVSAIVNQDNCKTSFEYNADSKIVRITNSVGKYVIYTYDGDKLSGIEHSDGSKYSIAYSGYKIVSISSERYKACLNYTGNVFEKATLYSLIENVSNGKSIACNKNISEIVLISSSGEIKLNGTTVPITYKEFRNEHSENVRYMFSRGVDYMGCCKMVDGIIVDYTKEENKAYSYYKKETAKPNHLNCSSFSAFDFGANTIKEEIKYNAFNDPTKKIVDWTEITPGTSRRTEAYYIYDINRRVIETDTHILTKVGTGNQTELVEITKYFYNYAGDVIRTETYIDGEEFTSGVEIEENVYNDKGVKVKSFTYNSLDSTSKFYSEYEVDEKGKVLAEYDSTGEHKTAFEYEVDGITTKFTVLPNGSKFAYGRDHSGEVTAISHSTDGGEGNSTEKVYTHGLLTLVKSGNNITEYTYDAKGRVTAVKLNGVDNYITYEYSGDGTDEETTVATMIDGTVCTVVKDRLGNVVESSCNSSTISDTYNKWNKIERSETSDGKNVTTEFNDFGNIISVAENGVEMEAFAYNSHGKLSNRTVRGTTYSYAYKDTAGRELDSISVGDVTVRPKLDVNGRNTGKSIEVGKKRKTEELISYVKFGDHATMLPSTVRYGEVRNGTYSLRDSTKYRYDSMGNICEVLENGLTVAKYEYDTLGRLVREDNRKLAKTIIYTYDNNGNILSRFEYNLTNVQTNELKLTIPREMFVYEYDGDNTDKLICYAGAGFTYDSIGNPTTYRGRTATWANGRQLVAYAGNTYSYDARGRRISKRKGNNTAINFTYDSSGNLISQSNGLEFLYDHTGVFAVVFNGATYFYRKNAQGDIIAMLDNEGHVVVKYTYDAWGNTATEVLDCNAYAIAELNPFRYRSYYYDTETGLYFLKSRYYDPELGRFMTIDDVSYLDPSIINGLNLYAYCGNNPVNKVDPTGHNPILQFFISAAAYVSFAVASIWNEDIRNDMKAIGWNPLNSDASVIVDRDSGNNIRKVSFYKGIPVIRFSSGLLSSFSLGAIFLNNKNELDETVIKHEFGHSVQFMLLGPKKYLYGIAIPSVVSNGVHIAELLITGNENTLMAKYYYDMPWERTADYFGGVLESDRVHTSQSLDIAFLYLAFLLAIKM